MTRDVEQLRAWIRVVLVITSICTTSVPVVYSFTPWWTKKVGRFIMLQAVAFAVATDLSLMLSVWKPKDILVVFWINAVLLTLIALATAALSILIWSMNFERKVPFMLLDDKFYQWIKKLVQIILPGASTLYFTIGQIWNLPHTEEVVGTIAAFTVFFGLILGLSSKTYNRVGNRFDGTVDVDNTDGKKTFVLNFEGDLDTLDQKDQVLFKINK